MNKLYKQLLAMLCFGFLWNTALSQDCSLLQAFCKPFESRCAATGSIKIRAMGGSGDYKYKVSGTINTNYTTTDSITGLPAGTYTVYVTDINTNCTDSILRVVVPGSYLDPRFSIRKKDVTCDNAANGAIFLDSIANGRAPFSFSIVAPSPMGVGTTNSTGNFTNLIAGNYTIELRDSCGGIQTRQITINNYEWWIEAYPFTRTSCTEVTGYILVRDILGNNNITGELQNFTYGVVLAPGDTTWQTTPYFTFTLPPDGTFDIVVKDNCGIIKNGTVHLNSYPSLGQQVALSNFTCGTFTASVTNIVNFFGANFCLYDTANNLLSCNSTGVFDLLPYGTYCIQAYDSCTDSTLIRCFTASPPLSSVDQAVDISNLACSTFTATITGQLNIYNPQYCIYTPADSLLACNNTGVFADLPYGNYCIKIKDSCTDTTITRCFEAIQPMPTLGGFTTHYLTCNMVTLTVNGDSVYNPLFCLYDSVGTLITCNATGIFDSIPIGNYCVTMHDECRDTTLTVCENIPAPVITNDLALDVRDRTCNSFTLTAFSSNGVGEYCLYNSLDSLIACDSSGIFTGLSYGQYCVTVRNNCPDTLFRSCISVDQLVPLLDWEINTSNFTCTRFTARVTNLQNYTNPTFCLYNASNVLMSCNTTGVFANLTYGNYCITVKDACFDSIVKKCFYQPKQPIEITGYPSKSCALGYANFQLSFTGTTMPYHLVIYNPDHTTLFTATYNSSSAYIDSIPGLPDSLMYTIVVSDNCGGADTLLMAAPFGHFSRSYTVQNKCPGASWVNGSGDIHGSIITNMGSISSTIIARNGTYFWPGILPTSNNGVQVEFTDLEPGTYIIRSSENLCGWSYFDTVNIHPYQFPSLANGQAFQCDIGGFSISAQVHNGIGPFMYEIIGSTPSTPSIITAPQASPVFTINNGNMYSLIRLRVVDACGNASLGDGSILPLALNGIVANNNCLMEPTTLSVDYIYGASYRWYKKQTIDAIDSTFLGIANHINIPQVMIGDTGIYVCYLSINNGCIERTYTYNLVGDCYMILPLKLASFTGRRESSINNLYWKTLSETNLLHFIIERKNSIGAYQPVGRVAAIGNSNQLLSYTFKDKSPLAGRNFYRLKMVDLDGRFSYSNIVSLATEQQREIFVYPNPAKDFINISFNIKENRSYAIKCFDATGRMVTEQKYTAAAGNQLQIKRTNTIQPGIYLLHIRDEATGHIFTERIIFL